MRQSGLKSSETSQSITQRNKPAGIRPSAGGVALSACSIHLLLTQNGWLQQQRQSLLSPAARCPVWCAHHAGLKQQSTHSQPGFHVLSFLREWRDHSLLKHLTISRMLRCLTSGTRTLIRVARGGTRTVRLVSTLDPNDSVSAQPFGGFWFAVSSFLHIWRKQGF